MPSGHHSNEKQLIASLAVKLASLFGHSAVGYTITYASVSTYYVSQPLVLGNVKLPNVVAGQAAVC